MAQYIEGSDRYQPMLLPAAVDDYVSSASPVRAIDAFVDSLDLPALGFKTRNDFSDGRSSYHSGSLLKLYLWGYLKRTRSKVKPVASAHDKTAFRNQNHAWPAHVC